jgi:TPP-dependent 2-oxoacid decarboxylase
LSHALDEAFERHGKFQLIEVMLERGDTSLTLRRFVKALHRT